MRRLPTFACVIAIVATSISCGSSEKARQRYFESGNAHFARQEFKEAIIDYRNALQKDSKSGEVRMRLAEAYERTDDVGGAAREFVRAADLLPASDVAQVKAGEYRLLAGKFEDARTLATRVIARSPANVNARILLGNALAGLKDFDGAIAQMQEAATADPSRASPITSIGYLELVRGSKPEAESSFLRAVEIDPKSMAARMALANFYLAEQRPEKAEEALLQGLTLDPKNVQANRALAGFYLKTGRAPEAESFLKTAAEIAGDGPSRLALADYYGATGRDDQALQILEPLSQVPATFVDAKTRIASLAWRSGRKVEAFAALADALHRDSRNATALFARGRFLLAEQRNTEAVNDLKAGLAASPHSAQGHFLLATAYRNTHDLDGAVKEYEEVLKVSPGAAAANYELAVLSLTRGQADSAVQYAQQASKASPDNREIGLAYLRALIAARQPVQAESQARMLLQRYPKDAEVSAAIGTMMAVSGKLAEARRQYEGALAIEPSNLEATAGLVKLDIQANRIAAAEQRLAARVAMTPRDPKVLMLAAGGYTETKSLAKAGELLQDAIAVDPSLLQAYDLLGRLYAAQGRLPGAQQQFEEIVKRQPRSVGAWTMLGILHELTSQQADAEKAYERALDIDPQAAVASNNLAWLYATSGRNLDVALQLAQTAKNRLPDQPEVSDTLGWIYLQKNLLAQALPALEESVRHVPTNPEFQFHLGLAHAKAGHVQAAKDALGQALKLNSKFSGADEARRALAALGT